jgi:hypothetical protein
MEGEFIIISSHFACSNSSCFSQSSSPSLILKESNGLIGMHSHKRTLESFKAINSLLNLQTIYGIMILLIIALIKIDLINTNIFILLMVLINFLLMFTAVFAPS